MKSESRAISSSSCAAKTDKARVTPELEVFLLLRIAQQKNGRAITEDTRPSGSKWKVINWEKTIQFALIAMADTKGWLHRPFGTIEDGDVAAKKQWFRDNRPEEKVQQVWEITKTGKEYLNSHPVISIDEAEGATDLDFKEGRVKQIFVSSYERNPAARMKCIEKYGWNCSVCNFDFAATYGVIGCGYIHVHHLVPLSLIKKEYKVKPIEDMRPVCPNCHAMLHSQNPPLRIKELKKIMEENK